MAVFIRRALVSALGVILGSWMLSGIHYEDAGSLIVAVVLLGLFSAVLKPVMVLMALPFVLLTLGVGLLFINALLYMLTGYIVEGFEVDGFGYAFLGAFIITLLNLIFNNWINGGKPGYSRVTVRRHMSSTGSNPGDARRRSPADRRGIKDDDVIDI